GPGGVMDPPSRTAPLQPLRRETEADPFAEQLGETIGEALHPGRAEAAEASEPAAARTRHPADHRPASPFERAHARKDGVEAGVARVAAADAEQCGRDDALRDFAAEMPAHERVDGLVGRR